MHTVTLYSAQQGHEVIQRLWTWAKPRLVLGKRLVLRVEEERRTMPQNDAIQARVRAIGKAAGYVDHDRLRMLLCEQWRHETNRPAQYERSIDGLRMVDVSNRTSRKDKSEVSEFLDWLDAFEASHNVRGNEPDTAQRSNDGR